MPVVTAGRPAGTSPGSPVPIRRGRRRAGTTLVVGGVALALTVPWSAGQTAAAAPATLPMAAAAAEGAAVSAVFVTPAAAGAGGVAPHVDRYPLGPADRPARTETSARAVDGEQVAAVSAPAPVHGYGSLGVTWTVGSRPAGLAIEVREQQAGAWSRWQHVDLDPEVVDGPDAGSAEAAGARDGTDPVLVGRVEQVQVRIGSRDGSLPADVRLDVIDPGTAPTDATLEAPALTGLPDGAAATEPQQAPSTLATQSASDTTAAASTAVAQPLIYSRAQWGADERLRSGSPSYGSVRGGVIHHTVNANGYSQADVPAIMRSIYAYHTQSRGWSDIGYNFLIDQFGGIWEGRYGGIDQPVIGAQTLNYNGVTFGTSAIGNFETTEPSQAMLDSYARLYAWKLGLSGVAADGQTSLYGETHPAIVGHRDLGQTACPGLYLYARVGDIRRAAARLQQSAVTAPPPPPPPVVERSALDHDLTGDGQPDAVLGEQGSLTLLAGEPGPGFRRSTWREDGHSSDREVSGGADVTGDGRGDLLIRDTTGALTVRPGDGSGGLGAAVWTTQRYGDARSVASMTDVTGDGRADLLVRRADGGLRMAHGRGDGSFARLHPWHVPWESYAGVLPAGDLDGNGAPDVLLVDAEGRGWLATGTTTPRGRTAYATAPLQVAAGWSSQRVTAGADVTGDHLADVLVTDPTTQLTWVRPGQDDGTLGSRLGGWPGWGSLAGASLLTDVSGDAVADVVLRSDTGTLLVRPGRGQAWARVVARADDSFAGARLAQVAGDWDGDGDGDVVAVRGRRLWLHSGTNGGLSARQGGWTGWRDRDLVTAVGDWTGDGRPDLLARRQSGRLDLFPGAGSAGVGEGQPVAESVGDADLLVDGGLWNDDGQPDVLTRRADGTLWLWPGTTDGTLGDPQRLALDLSRYDRLTGVGDWTGDGHPDLLGHDVATGRLHLLLGSPTGLGARIVLPLAPAPADNLG